MPMFAPLSMTTGSPEATAARATYDRGVATTFTSPTKLEATIKTLIQQGQANPAQRRRQLMSIATSSILLAGDICGFVLAYCLLLPFLPVATEGMILERTLLLAALATIALQGFSGLYPGYRLYEHEHLRRSSMALLKIAVFSGVASFFIPDLGQQLPALLAFLGFAFLAQPVLRQLGRALCRHLGTWGERAVVVGDPDRVAALLSYFEQRWQLGVRPEALSSRKSEISTPNEPSVALLAGDANLLTGQLESMRRAFSQIILLCDTPACKITGLRPADVGGEIGIRLSVGNRKRLTWYDVSRRVLDLVVAVPAALLAAPILLLSSAAIYIVDPGPVLFRQAREGLQGKPVHVLKMRTMYQDAEQRLEALFASDPAMKAEWSTHFKLRRDPRILPVIGRLLRSTSFDELPQLLNIIRGEMALVGPRPFPEYHLRAMEAQFRNKRHSVTPGLTGFWQISGRSNADLKLQQQLDEFYIDNRTLWFDWHILINTIPAVFGRNGAF